MTFWSLWLKRLAVAVVVRLVRGAPNFCFDALRSFTTFWSCSKTNEALYRFIPKFKPQYFNKQSVRIKWPSSSRIHDSLRTYWGRSIYCRAHFCSFCAFIEISLAFLWLSKVLATLQCHNRSYTGIFELWSRHVSDIPSSYFDEKCRKVPNMASFVLLASFLGLFKVSTAAV